MPPDGETFAVAPHPAGTAPLHFQVVEVPEAVAIVSAVQPRWDERERPHVEALLVGQVEHVAFLRRDQPGAAVVDGRGPARVLAIAVAALKTIGGWDEHVPIVVDVGGETVAVRLSWDGTRWTAETEASTF